MQEYLHDLFALPDERFSLTDSLIQWFKSIFDYDTINTAFSSIVSLTLSAVIAFFSISFITFFFLKDNARRAIGWCSFVIGKYEEARKYYDLLLQATKPKMQDWMNAGHLYYTLGNIETAINYYQKAQSMCEDRNMFLTFYLEDKKYLIEKGFSEEDIYILLDELL